MENMEILGVYYVPKNPIEASVQAVVANAVLGWYDALRFTSESGRAEISLNDGFFKKAFVIGGPETTAKAMKFLSGNPELATKAIAAGMAMAERHRDNSTYDRHWPTAYGLEQRICASGGPCKSVSPMPETLWDGAWEEAKRRASSYYQARGPTPVPSTDAGAAH
jgi:hypothetical protein